MERLTTNKSVTDMTMLELMHNNCYVDNDRNARYRDYEMEMDARDFARNLMATLTKDELPLDDAELDEEIFDNLTIDPFSDVRGLIALFYLNLCTKADLYEKLKEYEDVDKKKTLGDGMQENEEYCEWKDAVECFDNTEFKIQCEFAPLVRGTVPNNFAHHNFKFCPFCGRRIKWV